MKRKILKNFFFLSAISIIITTVMISFVMYSEFYKDMQLEVRKEAAYIAEAVSLSSENYLGEISKITSDRITLIDIDGNVIFDNRQKIENMSNHMDRPEVAEALEKGTGEIVRMSDTLGSQTFYFATKLEDGKVLRVASTTSNVYATVAENLPYMAGICLLMLGITVILAKGQTKLIVAPINEMDLENPLSNEMYDEFSPLLRKMEHQNQLIQETVATLKKEREELKAITQNMSEGLIVLNASGEIIIVNQRASEIFGKTGEGHYLTLNRSAEFREVAEKALKGMSSEVKLLQNGRLYQIVAMPTLLEGTEKTELDGVVVLALDITEKEETEKMRREFSANVSHELKTPLTSIIGFAEIIKEGIAKEEDVKGFSSKIYDEAKRLITLVEDIMKISRLDESGIEVQEELVDLGSICKAVVERLAEKATALDVKLELSIEDSAEPAMVKGVIQLLDELVFNLCDNAIKYNRKDGKVEIKVQKNPPQLIIADTGIGISQEEQGRVFERFYRGDKSHAKNIDESEAGGTGLGLSIVKHIVKRHNAEIKLDSELNVGTSIRITF